MASRAPNGLTSPGIAAFGRRASYLFTSLLGVVLAATHPGSAQTTADFAQQRFWEGRAAYDAHHYSVALEAFRASMSIVNSPNSRLYVARCLRELGQLDGAVFEYEETAREALVRARTDARYAGTRDAAGTELAALAPRVGHLRFAISNPPPQLRVRIGDREIPAGASVLSIPLMPGVTTVVADAPGYRSQQYRVTIAAGSEATLPISLVPMAESTGCPGANCSPPSTTATQTSTVAPAPRPAAAAGTQPHTAAVAPPTTVARQSYAFAVPLVIGGVGAIATAVLGSLTWLQYQQLVGGCPIACATSAQYDSLTSPGIALETATNVAIGVTAIGIVAGVVVWLVTRPSSTQSRVSVGYGTLAARAEF